MLHGFLQSVPVEQVVSVALTVPAHARQERCKRRVHLVLFVAGRVILQVSTCLHTYLSFMLKRQLLFMHACTRACMCMCVCACTSAFTRALPGVWAPTCIPLCVCIPSCGCMHVFMQTCMHACMHACRQACGHAGMRACGHAGMRARGHGAGLQAWCRHAGMQAVLHVKYEHSAHVGTYVHATSMPAPVHAYVDMKWTCSHITFRAVHTHIEPFTRYAAWFPACMRACMRAFYVHACTCAWST